MEILQICLTRSNSFKLCSLTPGEAINDTFMTLKLPLARMETPFSTDGNTVTPVPSGQAEGSKQAAASFWDTGQSVSKHSEKCSWESLNRRDVKSLKTTYMC